MFPIPKNPDFEPLGHLQRTGTVMIDGTSIKCEWFDQLPRAEYKKFLELICADTANVDGHKHKSMHIRQVHSPTPRHIM